jgi:Rrf2 family transcriptional regulator, cysteine metabolism repressor
MKLSRTACYAIHAVTYMASQGPDQIVIGHRAAKVLSIPEGFLLRILVALSRARILWSVKGPNGGYRLGRPAREITLLDVVEAVEGPLRGVVLFTPGDEASGVDRKLEEVFEKATDTVRKQLQKVRISDLVNARKK